MSHSFAAQIEATCRRRQRRRWMNAVCLALAVIVAAALVLIGLDRVLDIADSVGRLLLTLGFVGLCVSIVRRCFGEVWRRPVTPLQIAHEVEQQQPQLRDVVTSAWAFSQQSEVDRTAGSEGLRRATILQATAAVEEVRWQELAVGEPLRRAGLSLGSVVLVIGLLCWLMPQAVGIGLTRLINPFSTAQWPREHNLEFVEAPELLAAGEDLVLELRDTLGALPESVTMHYRTYQQGRWQEEVQPLAVTDGALLSVRRSSVQRSLEYRATGGDHYSMPWQQLEVVAPPRVKDLQLTVYPPDYTGLPSAVWDKSAPVFVGSRLELRAQIDQPITMAKLRSDTGREIVAQVGSDQVSLTIAASAWQISASGLYSLEVTTPEGLVAQASTPIALEVVADRPPQVRFMEPTEDMTVVPTATVALKVEASDELSLRVIDLVYRRSDKSAAGEQTVTLWRATADAKSVKREQVEYDWQLGELSLAANTTIELRCQATDAQPATGQTLRALRLTIVSEQELWQQLMERQTRLVEMLTRLLGAQRRQLALAAEWSRFPEWAPARWTNSSHAALFRQRQITDALSTGMGSVRDELTSLLESHRRNNLSRHDAVERLRTAQLLVQSLIDEPLPLAEEQLGQIARLVQNGIDSKQMAPVLDETARTQEKIIATLEHTIELLVQGNVLAQLEKRLVTLRDEQQDLAAHCQQEVAPMLLSAADNDSELLAEAVRRQRELARQLAELVLDMSQGADRLADTDPALAVRLSSTVNLAAELELQTTIQAAVDQLATRRVGRLASVQQETLDGLSRLLARLQGRDSEALAEQFKRLEKEERKLQRLRREVARLSRELEKLTAEERQRNLERLRKRQEELAERTEELARQLERLKMPRAAKATRQASEQLRKSSLESEHVREAKRELDKAQQQLTDQRRRRQVALARLQMAQLDAKLKALLASQQSVRQEIVRLYRIQQGTGRLTEAQRQSLWQLADQQSDLREETLTQAEDLVKLPVFAHLLKAAAASMQLVEDQLQQADVGEPTQALAEQAVGQLRQLAEAVRQERKNLSETDDQQSGGGGGGDRADAPQGQTLQLALGQLQLLKGLQTDLQTKTQALEGQLANGEPPTYVAAELAREQQELTDLAKQLVPEPADPPAEELFPNLEEELEKLLIE